MLSRLTQIFMILLALTFSHVQAESVAQLSTETSASIIDDKVDLHDQDSEEPEEEIARWELFKLETLEYSIRAALHFKRNKKRYAAAAVILAAVLVAYKLNK